jgi:hypothetical protein
MSKTSGNSLLGFKPPINFADNIKFSCWGRGGGSRLKKYKSIYVLLVARKRQHYKLILDISDWI